MDVSAHHVAPGEFDRGSAGEHDSSMSPGYEDTPHPKESASQTFEKFLELTKSRKVGESEAVFDPEREDVADFQLEEQPICVRVKRATRIVNQVKVCLGQPLVVHIPSKDGPDQWAVVPVKWQIRYARDNAKKANQHCSHAFDCMMFKNDHIREFIVPEEELSRRCIEEVKAANDPVLRIMIKSITRARDAVTDALISVLDEEIFSG